MIKVGIFFGGRSREREISFAGGRTVYDNLDKNLFEAIPIFVDSLGNLIELDWQYIYKGTIQDFYPPHSIIPKLKTDFPLYIESFEDTYYITSKAARTVGNRIDISELPNMIDFAFLTLHGVFGEDGTIQGILEWYGIPYSGSGIFPSALSINKIYQKKIMEQCGFSVPQYEIISLQDWLAKNSNAQKNLLNNIIQNMGLPFIIKSPNQGSTIGVSVVNNVIMAEFIRKINQSFFIKKIDTTEWKNLTEISKNKEIAKIIDIKNGIGLPITIDNKIRINSPKRLLKFLNTSKVSVNLVSEYSEKFVIIEKFIQGTEFSCIVIEDEKGKPIALPPTEIKKESTLFDYRAKYLSGISRKTTPINLPFEQIQKIRKECERLYQTLFCQVYARIDGFYTEDGKVILNDPNTTSGMLPSSFFFHQAAEIGMNPSQFLTYIIRTSIQVRIQGGKPKEKIQKILDELDTQILTPKSQENKIRVGVILGGYSSERHISVETGRNIYEKLSSSTKYTPIPLFLTGNESKHELYILPIHILLKDNADDIQEKITNNNQEEHPIIEIIKNEAQQITKKYVPGFIQKIQKISYSELSQKIDFAFIALHGRPGEDGTIQKELEKVRIPYNGSDSITSRKTINKYETNKILAENGIHVPKNVLFTKKDIMSNSNKTKIIRQIEQTLTYPFIVKPIDDGCSTGVIKIKIKKQLESYANLIFRNNKEFSKELYSILQPNKNITDFPQKDCFMAEELIQTDNDGKCIEITGGLLTLHKNGKKEFHIFAPSEVIAQSDILSLEEKFLTGEGKNITPARFSENTEQQQKFTAHVKKELLKVAQILNLRGYARIDAFVKIQNDNIKVIIIEVNSLPGMTPATCIFHQAALSGYKPFHFIDKIIQYSLYRRKLKETHNLNLDSPPKNHF
ncbi:MAG: hypothetical protein QM536_08930 [Chitinophagaceae bacterium]|nr:hypothetical protein [Chitinophagaceae bacterium]